MAGWVRLRGTLQVRPCKLGRRLLVCAVLRTRQDRGWASCPTRPRHASGPCGSRPCPAHPPGHGQFPAAAAGKNKIKFKRGSRAARTRRGRIRFPQENGSDPFYFLRYTIASALPLHSVTGKLSKAGGCGFAGCPRHGCRGQAPRDGFTASPQCLPPRPAPVVWLLHSATNHTHPRGAAPLAETLIFVSRKLKIRKRSAAIPQSSACNRSSLVFVTFQSAWSR